MTDVLILGMATFAVARYITEEKIGQPFREWFVLHAYEVEGRSRWLWLWATKLIGCTVCVGFWVAMVLQWGLAGRPWGWSGLELRDALAANAVTFALQFVSGMVPKRTPPPKRKPPVTPGTLVVPSDDVAEAIEAARSMAERSER